MLASGLWCAGARWHGPMSKAPKAELGQEAHSGQAHHGPRISSDDSRIGVYVVRTNEELIIAQHTLALVKQR